MFCRGQEPLARMPRESVKSPADALPSAEQEAFARSVENVKQAAVAHLRAKASDTYPIAFIGNLHRGIDRVVQLAVDRGTGVACKTGCSYCCHARVEASAAEVFRIADEILGRPLAEIEAVMDRLRAHAAANEGKAAWNERTACPFLSNDLCSIYAIRPAGCRKAHSLDIEAYRVGADRLPQSFDIVLGAEALMQGTAEAYRQTGLDAARHAFVKAMLVALTDRQAGGRWLDGMAVFDGCGP